MKFSTSFFTAILAATAAAAPTTEEKRATANGSNQNGSIFRFGSAADCNKIFRQSGACGISTYFKNVNPQATFVAMPAEVFDKYGAAQHNKLCGKQITMTRNGVTRTAIVADRNLSQDHSIDMCLDNWTAFGGKDNDGTLRRGIQWSINF
ncbi:hypothetical protein PT974_07694 [Cladobotryum mycophilum]|uniref:Uncharacterized protein n=1 Tax=Cladobotryum mycophilum TaxID=491253 RepID=A0ABR0SHQ3_9HYPO